jgi:hypothetical protein
MNVQRPMPKTARRITSAASVSPVSNSVFGIRHSVFVVQHERHPNIGLQPLSMLSLPNRMKTRTGYLLALTLVATTLCAGRCFDAGPGVQPEARLGSDKLVARFTRSFSRTVSHSPLIAEQHRAGPITQPKVLIVTDRAHNIPLSPLQLHLPPPLA